MLDEKSRKIVLLEEELTQVKNEKKSKYSFPW